MAPVGRVCDKQLSNAIMDSETPDPPGEDTYEDIIDKMLGDPAAKTRLLQKLGLDETPRGSKDKTDDVDDGSDSDSESVEDSQGKRKQPNKEALVNLTPSGKSVGASWPVPPF